MKKLAIVVMLVCVGVWALPKNEVLVPIHPKTPVQAQANLHLKALGQLQTHYVTPNPASEKPGYVVPGSRDSLLFDQAATGQYNAAAAQWDSVYPFEAEFADNFSIAYDATIDSVVWWGMYWNPPPPPTGTIANFWVKFYPDSTGFNMPKNTPVYAQQVDFTETDLGYWYMYEAAIPDFAVSAGVTYWIDIEASMIFPPQWGIMYSYPGNTPGWGDGQQGYMRFPLLGIYDWTPATTVFGEPGESAFQLYGTTGGGGPVLGDVIYELDVQTPTGDQYLLGVEFDGTYFYVSGADAYDTAHVYVIDTLGNEIWRVPQPTYCWGDWGWRDLAWDHTYAGADRIDTLYGSYTQNVDAFSIDLTSGARIDQGNYPGPQQPNRAMAWHDDSSWFFTANWDPCYKFSKTSSNLGNVPGPGSTYGAAYDTDPDSGGWVWWHSQVDPGTGFYCQIDQMEPVGMTWTGVSFGYVPTLNTPYAGSVAGGLCFYEGFRDADVLFALVQGDVCDEIVGIYVRPYVPPGIEENNQALNKSSFGFAPSRTIVTNTASLTYTLTRTGMVSLKVYDGAGRAVETLVKTVEPAGIKTITWNTSHLENGVYFARLEAEGKVATQKLIIVN